MGLYWSENIKISSRLQKKYHQLINAKVKNSNWSQDEDAQLFVGFNRFKDKKNRIWKAISIGIFDRCRSEGDCLERFNKKYTVKKTARKVEKTVHKKIIRWMAEEDKQLLGGIEKYGEGEWEKISQEFFGGTRT